jgi:uncharacterized protein YlxW (UPF0749 family)
MSDLPPSIRCVLQSEDELINGGVPDIDSIECQKIYGSYINDTDKANSLESKLFRKDREAKDVTRKVKEIDAQIRNEMISDIVGGAAGVVIGGGGGAAIEALNKLRSQIRIGRLQDELARAKEKEVALVEEVRQWTAELNNLRGNAKTSLNEFNRMGCQLQN